MLLFMDSFDHYAVADIAQKWTSLDAGTGAAITAAAGRRGTSALAFTAQRVLSRVVTAGDTFIMGVAFWLDDSYPSSVQNIMAMKEGSTIHLALRVGTGGELVVARGTTALATSAAGVINTSGYQYVEFKGTIHDSTGAFEVRVNGGVVTGLSLTGQDTQNGGTATVNTVTIEGLNARDTYFDDFYVCDDLGGENDDFLGDVRCDAFFANGNGNSSQLDGSDGNSVDNYLLVDEAAADGDTTYVQSDTVTEKDTYAFGNMSHTPATIHGVQITIQAKKDDAGTRSVAPVVRSDGVDTDGTTRALSTSYVMYTEVFEEDPDTSALWTKTGFDAAEFGVKVAA